MRWRNRLVVVTVAIPLVLASCTGDEQPSDGGGGGVTTGTGPTAATGATGATAPEGGGATVATATSDLGEIVVDAEGRTLYVFLADENGTSTCYEDCEATWPPLTVDGAPTGDGVDASLLGTAEREDGTTQVTLNDQPLYYFADDNAPGDTNGQAIGDVWYVVSPDGTTITDTP
jgi:predicted lipoprotein with Yx(FWY)xxD motif